MKPRKSGNEKPPGRSRDADLVSAEAALRRAAERALRRAAECGNAIAILDDGKIVCVRPDREKPSLRPQCHRAPTKQPRHQCLLHAITGRL